MLPKPRFSRRQLLPVTVMICVLFFGACADRVKTDLIAFKALDQGLGSSNDIIDAQNQDAIACIKDETTDPSTAQKAQIWYSKAQLIQSLSQNVSRYVEGLRTSLKEEAGLKIKDGDELFKENDKNAVMRLFRKQGKGNELYKRLKEYRSEISKIDSGMLSILERGPEVMIKDFGSGGKASDDFTKNYFDDISTVAALAMLNRFQNNIRIVENQALRFCVNSLPHLILDDFGPGGFASINSTYVRPLEKMEIMAGVVSFLKSADAEIVIAGKTILIEPDGVGYYHFKADKAAGKHFLPVQITFTGRDGNRRMIAKTVEYTVAGDK
ncbi:MAG: hypothetical protein E6H09_20655 [Bacteroidetes bacterium]|nr:MAG: hypothetical protein E6H09_20655 [Bacteroidota bacterium]